MASLLIRTFPMPAATLVTVAGEVDISTVAQLRGRLDTVPDRHTVVEMSDVALLSAAGVTVLLDLQDRLATAGARLVLAAAPRCVRRVLTGVGIDARLPVAPTVEAGFDSLTAVGPCRLATRRYPSPRASGTGLPRPLRG